MVKVLIYNILVWVIFFSSPNLIFAHPPDDSPTNIIRVGRSNMGHGGYGYIHTGTTDIQSEAAAAGLLDFSCRDRDVRHNVALYCHVDEANLPHENLITDSMKSTVLDRMRRQAIEFYALNYASATSGTSSPFNLNTLLTSSADFGGCNLSSDSPLRAAILNPTSEAGRALANRQAVIAQGLDSKNMAKAFLSREWLRSALGQREDAASDEESHNTYPASSRGITRYQFARDIGVGSEDNDHSNDYNCGHPSPDQIGACASLKSQLHRLETAFPALYPMSLQSTSYDTDSMPQAIESSSLFDQHVYNPTSSGTVPQQGLATTIRDLIVANGGSYTNLIRGLNSMNTGGFINLEAALNSAITNANASTASPALRDALSRFNQVNQRMLGAHAAAMRNKLRTLCDRRATPNLQAEMLRIGISNPNVVRQMILDMPPDQRPLAMAVMCDINLAQRIRPENQCHGVNGGPIPGPNAVTVGRRHFADFPFSAENYTRISQPSDSEPRTISLNLNVKVGPGMTPGTGAGPGSMAALQQMMQQWQSDANGYINCQLGAPGAPATFSNPNGTSHVCPAEASMRRTPPVRVQVNIQLFPANSSPPAPTINLHQCFRAEMESNPVAGLNSYNCNDVRQWNINRCLASATTAPAQAACNTRTPAAGSPDLNRQNAANLTTTTDSGVVRHEILHVLGLNDEYEDEAMVFNQIGESDSIMNHSFQSSRLYPRHVDQLLSPLRCPGRSL